MLDNLDYFLVIIRKHSIENIFWNEFLLIVVAGFDFGERALVTNEPRSATVMTITPTDLLVVDREVFSRYVKNILFCLFKFKSNYFW